MVAVKCCRALGGGGVAQLPPPALNRLQMEMENRGMELWPQQLLSASSSYLSSGDQTQARAESDSGAAGPS